MPAPVSPFAGRRAHLLSQLGDAVAIIPTAPEKVRNRDAHYLYRFDSYFWYLTGFSEPEAVLVLVGGKQPKSILFCREKNAEREIWDGVRYGPAGAALAFGFDEACPISEFDQKLPELLADKPELWCALGQDAAWDQRITQGLNAVRAQARSGKRTPAVVRDLHTVLDALRLVKDDFEIDLMQRAADIASQGHRRAMRVCRAGLHEYALEAELSYEFRRMGADAHAYTPIAAGGANACVLHYVSNNQLLQNNTLVLIDAGCEVEGYASDITRTFPVNGKFNGVQKSVYEIVLAAQQAAIDTVKPGACFIAPHQAALKVLAQGLLDLQLLMGSVDSVIESEAYKRFYMHRTSHWLGLDVHDAGEYKQGEDWMPLAAGMVLTIEPGLYIRAGEGVPEHLAGIGIRIEDDVLVTEQSHRVMTSAPKTVAEIEEVMQEAPSPSQGEGRDGGCA
jgi:Xaa-Pro aminopeptidase